jgi:hypothetical protein
MKKSLAFILLLLMSLSPLIAQKSERAGSPVSPETVVSVYQKGKSLFLQNAPIGEKLKIMSIVGVCVFEKRVDSTYMEIILELPKGYYIVKVGTIVRKIAIK